MNRKIVAVDCGKAYTKAMSFDKGSKKVKDLSFRSRVGQSNSLVNLTLDESAHVVSFKNPDKGMEGEWTIGAYSGDTSYSNSKKDAIHKMLMIVAIALVTDNGDMVEVSAGCPLSVYSDRDEKRDYFEYIFPSGRVDLVIDGKEHYFYVDKDRCVIFPECFGALFLYADKFDNKAGIVDIGGLNVNAGFFLDGVFDPLKSQTEKLGYYSLLSVLRSRLNAMCDANFNDDEVSSFLYKGYVNNFKDTAKIIEDVKDLHVQRIKKSLKEWDLESTNLIFIGGTSTILKGQIEKAFTKKTFIPEDANLINCKGFLKAQVEGCGYKSPV